MEMLCCLGHPSHSVSQDACALPTSTQSQNANPGYQDLWNQAHLQSCLGNSSEASELPSHFKAQAPGPPAEMPVKSWLGRGLGDWGWIGQRPIYSGGIHSQREWLMVV